MTRLSCPNIPGSGAEPRPALPRFYPIFDSADWVARALACGARLIQLRIKDAPEDILRAEITRARDLARAHGAALVVNDHWRLAIELGCDWLHLGQGDLDDADLAAIRVAGLRLGVSTHDEAELDRALAVGPDYVALGPVWPTILKQMKWAPQGLDRVADWKRRVGTVPLVAIGGLTPERGRAALEAGADVVSAVTDITLNPDPERRMREWLAATAAAGASRPRTPAGYLDKEEGAER
ncbi:thiamine phosphate synthase [Paracoccus sphaerophysae]|uniref:thiamine phosphate synthase n=1 Tax=Paracoccus sphaerophysae TaxID=690417 RepID=UPI0009FFF24F|nr:thiamine phosphate synthase [Paracoccus sphaerophysae]